MDNISVISYCRIKNGFVTVDDRTLKVPVLTDMTQWFTELYHHFDIQYPKFYKMDNLCKAGFLSAELLLPKKSSENDVVKQNWAVACVGRSSSVDDDTRYYDTIRDPRQYYPSPAIFVYTLANVLTGELCIRHHIGGESSCYIMDTMRADNFCELLKLSFMDKSLTHLLCGWVDFIDNQCDTLMMLLTNRAEEKIRFDTSFINAVY